MDDSVVKEEAARQAVILVAGIITIALMILVQRAVADPDLLTRWKMRSAKYVKTAGEQAAWVSGQAGIKMELAKANPSFFYTTSHEIITKVVHQAEKWYEGARQ